MSSPGVFRQFGPTRWLKRGRSAGLQGDLVLQAIPPSLRALDSEFDAEWRGGAFALAGYSVPIGSGSPFAVSQAPLGWLEALHGFGWLRHVSPHTDGDAQRLEAIVWDWLGRAHAADAVAGRDHVAARRVLSFLAHADLLLQTSDARFYDAVLVALRTDIVALERRARSIEDAGERLLATIALAQAGLCIENATPLQRSAEAALGEEFERHGHSFRKLVRTPDVLADLMLDLEALRMLYGMQGLPVPRAITRAKEVFCGVLGGLMLDGDRLARLGTARLATERGSIMASVARHVDVVPVISCHNADAGFVRLVAGETTLVIDVGAPFRSIDALALEASSGLAPMLVSDGLDARQDSALRGTIVVTPSQVPQAGDAPRRYAPTLEPTHSVEIDIDGAALQSIDATHAGAALNGHAHRRRLVISQQGRHIDGVDELRPLIGRQETPAVRYAVRFVLHPSVQVTVSASPDQLELTLSNGHRWRLAAPGRTFSVEGAVYRDGARSVPTLQVLVPADSESSPTVAWHWERLDADPSEQE